MHHRDRCRFGDRMGMRQSADRRGSTGDGRGHCRSAGQPGRWPGKRGATSSWDFHLVDVADQASVVSLVESASRFGGRIDGVVNAAGVAGGGPVHMLPTEEWDRVLQVNLTGTYLVAKHAIDVMLAQPAVGRIPWRNRHHREHRGSGGHRRRECLQRVKGWRGASDKEHGHRLCGTRHKSQRRLSWFHRHADDRTDLRCTGNGSSQGERHCGAQDASNGPTRGDRCGRRILAVRRCLIHHRPRIGSGWRIYRGP